MNPFFIARLIVLCLFTLPLALEDWRYNRADLRLLLILLSAQGLLVLPDSLRFMLLMTACATAGTGLCIQAHPRCLLGTGDILYTTALALAGGWKFLYLTVLAACLIGLIVFKKGHRLPFITLLAPVVPVTGCAGLLLPHLFF